MIERATDELRWVRQEHSHGCAAATLAMLLGYPYQQVVDLMEERDWDQKGVSYFAIDEWLAAAGYALQRRFMYHGDTNIPRVPWPPEPWAPLHYASVMVSETSPGSHMVVMDAVGDVWDPLVDERRRLTDYHQVYNVAGLWRVR